MATGVGLKVVMRPDSLAALCSSCLPAVQTVVQACCQGTKALLGGSDVTLKKFYKENGRVRLQPANPAMQPMIVDPALVQLQGVVIGVMRKY